MSLWIFIIGAVISLNCLLAWASNSHGSKCLSMWLGSSYGLGLLVTLTSRFLLPDLALLDFPFQQVVLGVVDLGLLGWLLTIITRNDDLKPYWRFLAFAQVSSIVMHTFDVATVHQFKNVYYGALDAILLSMIVTNLFMSARHGISAFVLFPRASRGVHPRGGHG